MTKQTRRPPITADMLNDILAAAGQISRLSLFDTKNHRIVLNGIEYSDACSFRQIRRRILSGDGRWLSIFDRVYIDHDDALVKEMKREASSRGGKTCQAKYGHKIRENLNTGVPWNKGMKGDAYLYKGWQTGQTKHTDERLMRMSVARMGEGNPMYGKRMTAQQRAAQSELIRSKIRDGVFSPRSNNRNTRFDTLYDGVRFRSSWEAIFYAATEGYEYETLRVDYIFDGSPHVYIVDFVNHTTRVAVEVKPAELLAERKTQAKVDALKTWCNNNAYTFRLITKTDVVSMIPAVDETKCDENLLRKMRAMYATSKTDRNH